MEAMNHYPSRLGTVDDMIATGTSVTCSRVPMCPPPCTCPDCQTYYYTSKEQMVDRFIYTNILTDAQAKAILAHYIQDMYEAQQYLRSAILQNGDHILSRWRKRTQPKRAALLQQAEPDLPQKKGLIAELDYGRTTWQVGRQTKYRKCHLLPYLDVETLVKNPLPLIGLIHTRAKDTPEEWAPYDHEQLRSAWGLGLLNAEFNAGAVFMYGTNYGTLTKWEAKAAHRFDVVGFPRARLIIEAQATLLRFLRRVVEKLVEGLPGNEPASATKWGELIGSGLKMTGDAACWSNFVNQPFTMPPRFDINALVAQAKARFEATSDHLWLLQTEPSYLKRYMRKISQMESVQSTGRNHVGLIIIDGELAGDIDINWFWRNALLEFRHLQGLYQRYRDSIAPGSPLPKKVDDALGALELVLVNEVHTRSKQLHAIISQRPGFRNIYRPGRITKSVLGNKEVYETRIRVKKEFTTKEGEHSPGQALAYRTERLWWILTQLQGPPDSETRFRYAMLLDMLNDHLESSSPTERERLDEILYEKLSDYVALLELLWAVRMHCPRNTIRTIAECVKTEDRMIWRAVAHQNKVLPNSNKIDTVGALTAFQAATPPSGPRNCDWLQKFQALHATSQDYWRKMYDFYRQRYMNSGLLAQDIVASTESLIFWKDPNYTARLETKREQILADTKKVKIPESEDVFLPLPTTPETPVRLDLRPAKAKPKTRGEARPEEPALHEEAETVEDFAPAKITLPKRSYATFRYMFPTSPEERQKHVEWETFVTSMADAAFTARNGGGSIVTFEDKISGGKIIFHRPHPDPNIDPVMLQSMGRRMNKWFGWTRDTFALADKAAKSVGQ